MPELRLPVDAVRTSFLSAMEEFRAEGRGSPRDISALGREIREWGGRWSTPEGFGAYVRALRGGADERTARLRGWVPSTTWWWVDADEYVGRIALRHRLNDRLLEVGGHIGYDVRPSARRRGHATAMLRAVLPIAGGMGIEFALLTCDAANEASRRVIESNGGVLEDERNGTLRFWVPTAAR